MCTELLPPDGYPVAVKYIISYRITSYKDFLKEGASILTETNLPYLYEQAMKNILFH
jgi:hypothetical protein